MFKLVVVAGKMRGEEFPLQNGENVAGRDDACQVHIPVQGVSKNHFSINVTGDAAFVKDLGSSNGTFINGKLVKGATVKNGDKIALPDTILQVVEVVEKKVIIKKKKSSSEQDNGSSIEDLLSGGPMPKALPQKLVHIFKYKVMTFFYNVNQEYEWKILIGIAVALLAFLSITFTIFPILQDTRGIVRYEAALRGAHYADEIARLNARALEQKRLDQVDSSFLDNEEGVSYELFDLEGRIVRPIGKLNAYTTDAFSIKAREWAIEQKNQNNVLKMPLGDGLIGIAQKILAYDTKLGVFQPVGIIAIQFRPKSLQIIGTRNSTAYLEALATSVIVAIFFYGLIYFLTIRPLEELKILIEEAMRGRAKNVNSDYLMEEIDPLRNSVNSLLQRLREFQNDGETEMETIEEDGPYVQKLVEFMEGSPGASMILNSEKVVERMNVESEDLLGFREIGSQGESLMDVCREQGIAATIIELCDQSANNGGTRQFELYDIGGSSYNINVASMMGKDNFAKGFFITFVKDE